MGHLKWENLDPVNVGCFLRIQHMKANERHFLHARTVSVHQLEKLADPLLGSRRTGDGQRPLPRILVEVFDEEKWSPAEMVAVEMTQ